MCPTPQPPKGALCQSFQVHTFNPHGMEGIAKRTPDPLNNKKKGGTMCLGVWGGRSKGGTRFMHFFLSHFSALFSANLNYSKSMC